MNRNDRSTPDVWKGFVPRPAPPHVRQKVLAAAEGIRPAGRFLTSAQWGMAAVCALLMIGALAADAILSTRQTQRLDSLLNDPPAASSIRDTDQSVLEELVGVDQARVLSRHGIRPLADRASRTEGRTDWNVLSFEEKEDVDVHAKNPR